MFVLLIAALVTAVELALAAWLPGLHAALGIFLPLIVTNCLVLARAEAFASRQPIGNALLDGFAMGGGFLSCWSRSAACAKCSVAAASAATCTCCSAADASTSGLRLFGEQHGFLLALLPPGAFILLGLGLAWRHAPDGETRRRRNSARDRRDRVVKPHRSANSSSGCRR